MKWSLITAILITTFTLIAYQNCSDDFNADSYNQNSEKPTEPNAPKIASAGPNQDFDSRTTTSEILDLVVLAEGGQSGLTYQWYKNEQPITGATQTTLDLGNSAKDAAGTYYVVVTNAEKKSTQSENILVTFTQTLFKADCSGTHVVSGKSINFEASAEMEIINDEKVYTKQNLNATYDVKTCTIVNGTTSNIKGNRSQLTTPNIGQCYTDNDGFSVSARFELSASGLKACGSSLNTYPTNCTNATVCEVEWE